MDLEALKQALEEKDEVLAAYLFGSAAQRDSIANDVDILLLLQPGSNKYEVEFDLKSHLAEHLGIPEKKFDFLFFEMDEADPKILYKAIDQGILLKNANPQFLSERINRLSSYFLENDSMIEKAEYLRRERIEAFCEDR
ncbi:MAG: nucleotidyltransferase domain-containing protein [Desulfobacteraceae bacterium]